MKKCAKWMAFLLFSVCVTACSDEDKENGNLGFDLSGIYTGYTEVSSAYFSGYYYTNQSLSITPEGGAYLLSYSSDTWGDFSVTISSVEPSSDGYAVSGEGTCEMSAHGVEANSYACTVSGTFSSDKESFTLSIVCPGVMGGTTLSLHAGDIPLDLAAAIADTYTGYTVATCAYFSGSVTPDESVALTAVSLRTVNIHYLSETYGDITIEGAAVGMEGTTYTLSGSGSAVMGMGDSTSAYDCSLTGTVENGKTSPSFCFTVPAVMGGLTIEFATGEAPSEDDVD